MWKSDKNETFDVLFILFDVLIFVVVINYSFSTFWSTQKTFSTFWFRRSDQLKRPFRRSEIFGLSTFWSSTFRPPANYNQIFQRNNNNLSKHRRVKLIIRRPFFENWLSLFRNKSINLFSELLACCGVIVEVILKETYSEIHVSRFMISVS